MHYHLSSSSCYTLMAPLPSRRMKAVNNFTVSGYLVCVRDNSWDRALKRTKICFCFLSISLHCLWCSTLWPRSSLCTSSLFPFFSFLSPVLLLCTLSLLSPSSLPLPPLSPCTLWYADMQEFLGLKMIDQTCQPWLLLLKMAAWQCVCRRLVRVWVTPHVIGCNVFVHSSCVVGRSSLRALGDWKPFLLLSLRLGCVCDFGSHVLPCVLALTARFRCSVKVVSIIPIIKRPHWVTVQRSRFEKNTRF